MTESFVYTIIGVCVLAGLAIFVAIVRFSLCHTARIRDDFESFLKSNAMPLPASGKSESTSRDGIHYTASLEPGSRNHPTHYRISIAANNRGIVKVRREQSLDRFFKRIGFVVEVQTKDAAFDRTIFIDSAEPVFARALFSKAPMRAAVMSIFECGFSRISIDAETISAELHHKDIKGSHAGNISDAIASLNSLTVDQPRIPAHLGANEAKAWRWRLGIVYTLLAIIVLMAAAGAWLSLTRFTPVDESIVIAYSLPLALLASGGFLVLFALLLRGRSSSHVHFGICAWVAICASIPLSYSGLCVNNAVRDRSELKHYEFVVAGKKASGNRNRTYRLFVPSWRVAGEIEDLVVSRHLYMQTVVAQTRVAIATRAGYSGYEWFAHSAVIIASSGPSEPLPSALKQYE